jgi:hypothetical protein
MENIHKYYCNSCNKQYKSYKTFWYHNKTQHKIINDDDIITDPPEILKIPENTLNIPDENLILTENDILDIKKKKYICEYCNKKFTRIDNMHFHQSSSCKKKEAIIKENEEIKLKLTKLDLQLEEFKKLLLVKMNKECKAHPRTIEKINRALANKYKNNNNAISSNNTISNSNNNNNNGVINNYNIIALGKEKLEDVLSKKQQVNILKKDYNCLPELIKLVHCNDKFPQFKNILITSVINNIGYIYDEKEKQFIATTKDELLETLITHRMSDIVGFHETHIDELSETQQNTIQRFIDKMEDNKEFSEERKKAIKLIIYNNRDKVTNEIVSNLEIYI